MNRNIIKRAMLNDRIRVTIYQGGAVVLFDTINTDNLIVLELDELDEVFRFVVKNT